MAYRDLVLADGASHYWRLNELSGTTAADLGASPAPGTISGGVTLNTPGPMASGDPAMTFNGTTGKIVTAANVTVPVVVTIELWFKTTTSALNGLLSNRPAGTGLTGLYIGIQSSKLFVYSTNGSALAVTVINDNLWHHAVYVLTGTTVAFWVDGRLDSIAALTSRTVGETLPLGLGYDIPNVSYWNGGLDDVAIYPSALTNAQIAAHYAAGKSSLASWPARTWTANEFVTTQMMNNIRDQLNELHAQLTPDLALWSDVPFSASNFFGSGTTWTVTAGNILVNRVMQIGRLVIWALQVNATTVAGTTAGYLYMVTPYPNPVQAGNANARVVYAYHSVLGSYTNCWTLIDKNSGCLIIQAPSGFPAGTLSFIVTTIFERS